MKQSGWRKVAGPIIAKILAENIDVDEKIIRKKLKEAYPFGQRAMHPYKIWLDEIKRQRKKRKPKSSQQNINQINLF